MFRYFKVYYGLIGKSKRYELKKFKRIIVNKGPTCHSKSKESYIITQTFDYMIFSSKNLSRSLQFFIESDKFLLKKGSNKFKLSMSI